MPWPMPRVFGVGDHARGWPPRRRMPVYWPGVHQRAVARRAPPSSSSAVERRRRPGWTTMRDRQVVLARELEVALVVRRHGHDGAGAVLAQHEVRDPDRHRLAGERIDRRAARCRSLPSRPRPSAARSRSCARNARDRARGTPAGSALGREPSTSGCSGAEQHERRAVDRVDAGREDFDRIGRRQPRNAELTRAPSERPIQLRCITTTFSGHSVSVSSAVEQLVGVLR